MLRRGGWRHRFTFSVALCALTFAYRPAGLHAQQVTPAAAQKPAIDSAKEARLVWFRDAKYGLFIHWGLYAIPAGTWKGQFVPGIGEWIMNRAKVPVREYEGLT